jgi:hypothetical protein
MTDALVHRGPDDAGEFIAPQVGLGMRRLAIIDRAHGQQPMASDDGRLVLVFNGEIYNYLELKQALAADGCIPNPERHRGRPAYPGTPRHRGHLAARGHVLLRRLGCA